MPSGTRIGRGGRDGSVRGRLAHAGPFLRAMALSDAATVVRGGGWPMPAPSPTLPAADCREPLRGACLYCRAAPLPRGGQRSRAAGRRQGRAEGGEPGGRASACPRAQLGDPAPVVPVHLPDRVGIRPDPHEQSEESAARDRGRSLYSDRHRRPNHVVDNARCRAGHKGCRRRGRRQDAGPTGRRGGGNRQGRRECGRHVQGQQGLFQANAREAGRHSGEAGRHGGKPESYD